MLYRTFPKSTNILAVAYKPAESELYVTFREGARYRYKAVPAGVYSDLVDAPSVGKAFDTLVRRQPYEYARDERRPTTRLYDNLFPSQAVVHANGDNTAARSKYFDWRRDGLPKGNAWFTADFYRAAHRADGAERYIAWLLEPPELHPESYQGLVDNASGFDAILTTSQEHVTKYGWTWYAFGGTRIAPADRMIGPKSRGVSIVASPKRGLEGHRLRHELIEALGAEYLDAYGPEYRPIERKLDALAPYMFHVAIEAVSRDCFFSEALIDPLLTGVVPIYWGAPSIGTIFDTRGMILCHSLEELCDAVLAVSEDDYEARLPYIQANQKTAREYVCTEDWLYLHYPELFDTLA